MGMFDEIKCKVPLPVDIGVEHRDHWFQTKSLDNRLDYYEIREDGTLWKLRVPDEDPDWEKVDMIGEIVFYAQLSSVGVKDIGQVHTGWLELSAYFVRGVLKEFHLLILRTQ